jgi:uncharacterized protein (TIGR03382 family)
MKKSTPFAAAVLSALALASVAHADPVDSGDSPEFGIITPFDNAQVEITWLGSNAGYTGVLSLVDLAVSGPSVQLWNNHGAAVNDKVVAPRLYNEGERVDFTYQIIQGGLDTFATYVQSDQQQFQIDASNPLEVLVNVEDIRYPNGDRDHNDAMFIVTFSPTEVPAPGALALFGSGLAMVSRRRRG